MSLQPKLGLETVLFRTYRCCQWKEIKETETNLSAISFVYLVRSALSYLKKKIFLVSGDEKYYFSKQTSNNISLFHDSHHEAQCVLIVSILDGLYSIYLGLNFCD